MDDDASSQAQFRLVDLEIIKRFSLAVRQESAPPEEILAALDASRDAVLAAMGGPPPRGRAGRSASTPARTPRKRVAKKD